MVFPDDEAKLQAGRISYEERAEILYRLGEIAQKKYDEFVIQGGSAKGYNLTPLVGSLQFKMNVEAFENDYWLEQVDEHWTKVAIYFEYGTGLFNTTRAGKYRAGYIKPVVEEYLSFVAKDGKFVKTKRVKGVQPVFAMTKAIKYVEFNRARIQRQVRLDLRQNYEIRDVE